MGPDAIWADAGDAVTAADPGCRVDRLVSYATTADGSVLSFPLIVINGASPGQTVALIAGVHGDEYEGPAALRKLANETDPGELAGRLLIIPVANPPAFAAGTRTSPIDGENLARIFPGDPNGTVSHRLAAALMGAVVGKADVLIDSHSGGVRLAFIAVAGFYEGPDIEPEAAERSLKVAKQMGLGHLWRLPPVRGVLSYEAARRGIAVCGAEIGGRGNCRADDAATYLAAYRSVLAHHGMIEAWHRAPETRACLEGDWERTPKGGYLDTVVDLRDRVVAGQVIARVYDAFGQTLQEFRAGFDGVVMAVRHLNSVQPGDLAVCVVRETMR